MFGNGKEKKKIKGMIAENDPRVSQFGHPAPPWLVNYADLMTELVCFFIILYALSAVLNKDIQKAKKDIDKIIKEENLQAEVKMTKEGVRLTLEEKGSDSYFQVGKAELTQKMVHIMTKIGPLIKNMPNEVLIEGHSDNVPINSEQFPSNWELSSARALAVLHHLVEGYGVQSARISAIGYGEFRPRVPNDTPEHRAINRRVVFFIKNVPPRPEILDYEKEKLEKEVKERKAAARGAHGQIEPPPGSAPRVEVVSDNNGLVPVELKTKIPATTNPPVDLGIDSPLKSKDK